MGNCFGKQQHQQRKKSLAEIAPSDHYTAGKSSPPVVTLYGNPNSLAALYLRFALLYKPVALRFVSSETASIFKLRFGTDDPVSGSYETVLQYMDSKAPLPPLLLREKGDETTVVRMAALQHKSMMWQVERVARWARDMATRGGSAAVDPTVGTPRMEVKKYGNSYGQLLELLLEHAQMEERIIFPILQSADRGVCRCVNEEHARDLPIMNGIKEDIKSIGVLDVGTLIYREALHSLSARLGTLQENCREHFDEEEKNLLPLMEAADLTREQRKKVVEQCIDVMQQTHSHLFRFFIEGLLPHEALEYLDLVMDCVDKERVISMLRILLD